MKTGAFVLFHFIFFHAFVLGVILSDGYSVICNWKSTVQKGEELVLGITARKREAAFDQICRQSPQQATPAFSSPPPAPAIHALDRGHP